MEIINKLSIFFKNVRYSKLFITAMPGLCALCVSSHVFNTDYFSGLLILLAVVILQISAHIFDDFLEWSSGKTKDRIEINQIGIRGNFQKCEYIYKDKASPRKYFYIAFNLFILFSIIITFICIKNHAYILLLIFPILMLAGFLNYLPRFRKALNFIGTEIIVAFLCSFVSMTFIFYATTNCLTIELFACETIMFTFLLNILSTASLLNEKPDIITKKCTLPIIFNNRNLFMYFYLFLCLLPYGLTLLFIKFHIIPKLSIITLAMIPHTIWLFTLIYKFIKTPEKNVSWHFLMGANKHLIEDEQNNLSWYYVRFKFARNIFVFYSFLLILALLYYQDIFIF